MSDTETRAGQNEWALTVFESVHGKLRSRPAQRSLRQRLCLVHRTPGFRAQLQTEAPHIQELAGRALRLIAQ